MKKLQLKILLFVVTFLVTEINESISMNIHKESKFQECVSTGNIYAGVAQANIAPPIGYPHYRGISTGVHDSLYAKAIVFGQGRKRFAVIECDLLYMDRDITIKARSIASQK